MSAAIPVAVVDRVSPQYLRGTRAVRTWLAHAACPNGCKGGHTHGVPFLQSDAGSRAAHCVRRTRTGFERVGGDYRLHIPEALISAAYAELAERLTKESA